MTGDKLIFIISQPRSGSTLLQRILLNSEDIDGDFNESWFLLPYLSALRQDMNQPVYDLRIAKHGIDGFVSSGSLKAEVSKFLLAVYSSKLSSPKNFFLDKTPRYYEILNEIRENLPGAKIILLLRNPLDVLVSVFQRWKPSRMGDLVYFSRDILDAPLKIQEFLGKNDSNQNVLAVRYEDIVSNPNGEFENIFDWLDLEYKESYTKYYVDKKPLLGDNKVGMHVKPHSSSINSHRNRINKRWMVRILKGYSSYLAKGGFSLYELDQGSNRYNWTFKLFLSYHNYLKSARYDLNLRSSKNLWYYLLMKLL